MQIIQAQPSARTLRQNALNDSLNQAIGGFQQMDQQAKTKRQEALAINEHTAKLREAGYDVTPDMVKQSMEPEQSAAGKFIADSSIGKFFGMEKQAERPDLYGKRTDQYNAKVASDADDKKFKRKVDEADLANKMAQNEKLMAEAYKLRNEKPTGGGLALTKGQEAADKDYAKQYTTFSSKGVNNTRASIDKLGDIAKELEDDAGFGEASGTTWPLPDLFRSSDAIRRRDMARGAANSSLKELFGGNLSDSEREAAANEFYNDKLGAKENAKIIRGKIAELEANREAEIEKAKYFEGKGSLSGYKFKEDRFQSGQEEERVTLQPLNFNGNNPSVPFSPTNIPNMSPVQSAYAGEFKGVDGNQLLSRREQLLQKQRGK